MKKLYKKSPVLFVLIASLLVVSVAGAAFLWSRVVSGSAVALDAPNFTLGATSCAIIAGPGTVEDCGSDGSSIYWELAGIDDDTVFQLTQSSNQNVDTAKTLSFAQTAEPAISAQSCLAEGVACDGYAMAIDQYVTIVIELEFGNVTPSETVIISDMVLDAVNQ